MDGNRWQFCRVFSPTKRSEQMRDPRKPSGHHQIDVFKKNISNYLMVFQDDDIFSSTRGNSLFIHEANVICILISICGDVWLEEILSALPRLFVIAC
jgi:hypothetical protein